MHQPFQDDLLAKYLLGALGDVAPQALELVSREVRWVTLAAGQTLMTQGEAGDSTYLSISGRLRAYVRDGDGIDRPVREMARGEVIGEMSLYTDEPRSATVVAVRDSVLVQLDKAAFLRLLALSPEVSLALTRRLIHRLRSLERAQPATKSVAIGMLAISDGVDLAGVARLLVAELARHGRVCLVDAQAIDEALQQPGIARGTADDADAERRIALHLDALEAAHDQVLLVADAGPTAWTRRCTRRCDELLLLADAARPPALHEVETAILLERGARIEAPETLVLLHPAATANPRGTRQWLARRPVRGHVHVRPSLPRDVARLARLVSGTAIGLVLAGGGARGFAHLGVWRALQEHGVELDWVGGTSMGSAMGALVASDQPYERVMAVAKQAFSGNPTGDFNLLPMLSLVKGRRLKRVVEQSFGDLLGSQADIEDLWKNFFCVASNYSQACEQVLQHGTLSRAVRASAAIPGALPPVVIEGDLLCDGGTFDNYPVRLMRGMPGVGCVLGVDLGVRRPRPLDDAEPPSTWELLRDRLRPYRQRHYRYPSLASYLINVTILYSASRQKDARRLADVHFDPPLARVGLLQWNKFDSIVQQGHAHAQQVLAGLPDALRRQLGQTSSGA